MKALITFALLMIILPLYSQTNRIYSVSINGGAFFPIEKLSHSLENGYNFGIDLETRKSNFGVFLASKLNILHYKITIVEFEYGTDQDRKESTIGEITTGGRWYLGQAEKLNANFDFGLGIYTGNYYHQIHWGIQPGFGGNVPISRELTANLNIKLNVLEVDEWETYIGIYLGLSYSYGK